MATFKVWAPNKGAFRCPGCDSDHVIVFSGDRKVHEWNGDATKPTLRPSVVLNWTGKIAEGSPARVCHSFVTDGQIQFLADCTHALVGQTVPIPDWPS